MEFLSEFDFTILHRPCANNMAEALSRRPDLDRSLLTSISTSDNEEDSLIEDYQKDRKTQAMIDILRFFVNHGQNNLDYRLPFCEFAINDMLQESTKKTPFRIVQGWHPTSPADLSNLAQGSVAQPWLECQQEALVIARDCILSAQARQTLYADQHQHGEDFRVGEKVLVHRD